MNLNDYFKQEAQLTKGLLDVTPEQDNEAFWNAVGTAPIDPRMAAGSWAGALLSMMDNGNLVYRENRNSAKRDNAEWLNAIGPMKQLEAIKRQEEFDAAIKDLYSDGKTPTTQQQYEVALKTGNIKLATEIRKGMVDGIQMSQWLSRIENGPLDEGGKVLQEAAAANVPLENQKFLKDLVQNKRSGYNPIPMYGPNGEFLGYQPATSFNPNQQRVSPGQLPQRQNGNFGSLGQFESGNNPNAVSPKGAYGSPQITRDTFYDQRYYIPGKKFENDQDRIDVAKNKFEKDLQWGQENENAKWNVLGLNADQLARGAYFGGRQGVMNYSMSSGKTDPDDGNIPMSEYIKRTQGKSPFDAPTQLAAGPGFTGGIEQTPQVRTKERLEWDMKQQGEFNKQDRELAMKSYSQTLEDAKTAPKLLAQTETMRTLLEDKQLQTGPIEPAKVKVKAVLDNLGIDFTLAEQAYKDNAAAWKKQYQGITDAQIFIAISTDMAIQKAKQLGYNPSNADLKTSLETTPALSRTKEANLRLIDDVERWAKHSQQTAEWATQQRASNPNWWKTYDSDLMNKRKSLDEGYKKWYKEEREPYLTKLRDEDAQRRKAGSSQTQNPADRFRGYKILTP